MRQIFKARGTGICLALSFDYSLYSVSSSAIFVCFFSFLINEIVAKIFYYHHPSSLIRISLIFRDECDENKNCRFFSICFYFGYYI